MKIKICGITRPEEIDMLNAYPPDYAGFVFAGKKRYIAPAQAKKLLSQLKKEILPVGVFVNESMHQITEVVEMCSFKAVQLHGEESAEYIAALKKALPSILVIKAVPTKEKQTMRNALSLRADYFLFDTYDPVKHGGTGQLANWQLIEELYPQIKQPFFIAGGLNIENIQSVKKLHPYGADLSSGLESPQGGKEAEKIKKIFELKKHWEEC